MISRVVEDREERSKKELVRINIKVEVKIEQKPKSKLHIFIFLYECKRREWLHTKKTVKRS